MTTPRIHLPTPTPAPRRLPVLASLAAAAFLATGAYAFRGGLPAGGSLNQEGDWIRGCGDVLKSLAETFVR